MGDGGSMMSKEDMRSREKDMTKKDAKRKIAKKKCMKKMGEDDGSDEYAMKLKKCMQRKKSFGHGMHKKPSKKEHVRKQRGNDTEKDGEKPEKDGEGDMTKPDRSSRLLQDGMMEDGSM